MDGENHGSKPNEQMDDLGVSPPIFEFNTHLRCILNFFSIEPNDVLEG